MARHPDPLPLATVTAAEFPVGLVGAHEDDVWEWAELVCPRCAALAHETTARPSLYRRLLARLTGVLR